MVVALTGASGSAQAGTPVTVRGVFTVIYAHDRPGESKTVYALESEDGRAYELKGYGAWHQTSPGARVEVRGERDGAVITVSSVSVISSVGAGANSAAPVTGARRILVITVAWSGAPLEDTSAQKRALFFGTSDPQRRSLRQYYEDVSYGQLSFTGSVTPNLSIPDPTSDPGSCPWTALANSADSAARGAGFDPAAYDYTFYVSPQVRWG